MAFRWLSANAAPDHRLLSRFRRRQLAALDDLFAQVLVLCSNAGSVKVGGRVGWHQVGCVSIEIHRDVIWSSGDTNPADRSRSRKLLAEVRAVDAVKHAEFGPDRCGDELTAELATREGRLAKMRQAKATVEAEAAEPAAEKSTDEARNAGKDDDEVQAAAEAATPNPKAQRSFTDADAQMMETNYGLADAYNAQDAADEYSQVIVASYVAQAAVEISQLPIMLE